jgi:hypothetical protein
VDIIDIVIDVIKLTAVVIGVMGALKKLYGTRFESHSRLREEYIFAKGVLSDLSKDNVHPYLKEKGYQALVGATKIRDYEVSYLLSLNYPSRSLKDFIYTRALLENFEESDLKLKFKSRYYSKLSRGLRKWSSFVIYFIFGFALVIPMTFFKQITYSGVDLIFLLSVWYLFSIFGAIWALTSHMKISRAEVLVDNQEPHSWTVGSFSSINSSVR